MPVRLEKALPLRRDVLHVFVDVNVNVNVLGMDNPI